MSGGSVRRYPVLEIQAAERFVEAKRLQHLAEVLPGQALGIQEIPLGLWVHSEGPGALLVRGTQCFSLEQPGPSRVTSPSWLGYLFRLSSRGNLPKLWIARAQPSTNS